MVINILLDICILFSSVTILIQSEVYISLQSRGSRAAMQLVSLEEMSERVRP
jgi:hypothetical protein